MKKSKATGRETGTASTSSFSTSPTPQGQDKEEQQGIDIIKQTQLSLPSLSGASEQNQPAAPDIIEKTQLSLPSLSGLVAKSQATTAQTKPITPIDGNKNSQKEALLLQQPYVLVSQHSTSPSMANAITQAIRPIKRRHPLYLLLSILLLTLLIIGGAIALIATHIYHPDQPHGVVQNQHQNQSGASTTPGHTPQTTSTPTPPQIGGITASGHSIRVGAHPSITIQGNSASVNIRSGQAGTIDIRTNNNGGSQQTNTAYQQSQDAAGQENITLTTSSTYSTYDIIVPHSSQVHINIPNGSISIDGITNGAVTINSGKIAITNVHGSFQVAAISSDINAQNIQGLLSLKTVNGSIRANSINGTLRAQTQNGDIILQQAALHGQSTIQTTSGSIRFTGTLDPQGTDIFATQSGNATLNLPDNAAFQLQATTTSGTISNAFGSNTVGGPSRPQLFITIGSGSTYIQKNNDH